MKKLFIYIALSFISALTLYSRDRLYIEDFRINAGETLKVPVLLLNDTAYSGLQTDLFLPAGLSLDIEDDEYIIDLTSRKDISHSVTSNLLTNGAIRIYVSSMGAREFSGNKGALMTLSITAANNFNGEASVELRNTICAEAIGTRHTLQDEICFVNHSRGDVNRDGEVSVADINDIIDLILTNKSRTEADVNQDGEISVADINVVIDIILGRIKD